MLKKLLNLLPAPLVRQIGDSSFESLESRGEIQTWMVATKKPNDGDDDLVEFNFDDFDFDDDSAQESGGIDPDYISRHISRIPQHGDNSRWRLADYLNMFDNLSRDGTLTNEQRQAVDNFAAGYQPVSSESDDCTYQDSGWQSAADEDYRYEYFDDDCEMDFPECQYVAVGLDLVRAIELGDSWRRGELLPDVGHPAADRISNRLNQMQSKSQRTALRK